MLTSARHSKVAFIALVLVSCRKLGQELAATQEASRIAASRNRGAIAVLRDGLARVEETVAERATEGREQIQCIFSVLQVSNIAKFAQKRATN